MNKEKESPSILGFMQKVLNFSMFFFLMGMVIMVFTNALLRYIFNSGWPVSEELSRFMFVWVTMIGTIIGLQQNKHIGVDLLTSRLKGKVKEAVELVANLLIFIILLILSDGAFNYFTISANTPSAATKLPMGVVTSSLIVCSFSMVIIIIIKLYRNIKNLCRKGEA